MNEIRKEAFKLRKAGWSYNEIQKELGVAKSTLSSWFSNLVLSPEAVERLKQRKNMGTRALMKRNKQQTHWAYNRAKQKQAFGIARVAEQNFSNRDLLLIGAALYWGEGYKKIKFRDGKERTSHPISFVNADPQMIKMFISFLKTILKANDTDIVLTMRLYDHMNENRARQYWRSVTNLSDTNFRKSTWLISGASKRKRSRDSLPHGTLQVALYSTDKFHELTGMIEGLKKTL